MPTYQYQAHAQQVLSCGKCGERVSNDLFTGVQVGHLQGFYKNETPWKIQVDHFHILAVYCKSCAPVSESPISSRWTPTQTSTQPSS